MYTKLKKISIVMMILIMESFTFQSDFLAEQKKFERVQTAVKEKEENIKKNLKNNDLQLDNFHMLLVVYKEADELELYVRKKTESTYQKLISYPICKRSGKLGPKRKQGDKQVPEGFYYIDRFNPSSSYYLSLGLNYPNQSDRKKSNAYNLGGDIFIHGSCETIGCLPMTDDKIKEIYLYAVHAKNNGQTKIPVYVFPFKMTSSNMEVYKKKYKDHKGFIHFWTNLKEGYDQFVKDHKELLIKVDKTGTYIF